MAFRFTGLRCHLTYKTHVNFEEIKIHLPDMEFWSIVHEIGDDANAYEHTHVAAFFKKKIDTMNPRFFDVRDIHPNINVIKSDLQWRNTCEYHMKAPIKLDRSEKLEHEMILIKRIRQAPSLYEACELAGIEIRTVSDVKLLRDDKRRRLGEVSEYNPNSWTRPILENFKALFIHGGTNLGKTQWAIAHFKNALVVGHMDALKSFDPEIHDGIIFDDMSFNHLPREAVIQLLDWDLDRDIHCRHACALIPKHTRKIFTSNKTFNDTFPYDEAGAIARRISHRLNVVDRLFRESPLTLEGDSPDLR